MISAIILASNGVNCSYLFALCGTSNRTRFPSAAPRSQNASESETHFNSTQWCTQHQKPAGIRMLTQCDHAAEQNSVRNVDAAFVVHRRTQWPTDSLCSRHPLSRVHLPRHPWPSGRPAGSDGCGNWASIYRTLWVPLIAFRSPILSVTN